MPWRTHPSLSLLEDCNVEEEARFLSKQLFGNLNGVLEALGRVQLRSIINWIENLGRVGLTVVFDTRD
jgi:hypothetical protein